MKSPFFRTLVMAAFAALASIIAAYYYPWPEKVVVSAIVDTPLFESYDSSSVRSIRIVKFSAEKNGLDQILLRRSGEKWIVPSKKNFIATNAAQIAAAANSLIDRTVLEETTDEQQAYLEYGVVDPIEYQSNPNRSALGTKIILEDRNRRELASLIVGARPKSDRTGLKHYVRVPGQPSVYVIEFDRRALSTDFKSWVDPNLLQLSNQSPINRIQIENYRIAPESKDASKRQLNYRARFGVAQQKLGLMSVEAGGKEGNWTKVGITPEVNQQLQVLGTQIGAIRFSDVIRKSKEVAKLLKSPNKDADQKPLDSLRQYGFFNVGFENASFDLDSEGGEISVQTGDGVVVTLWIGSLAKSADSGNLLLSRHVMVLAGVDESILPEPKKPAANSDAEAAEKSEKAYLRAVEARKTKLKSAYLRASEFNQKNADWIYVVSDDVIDKIRPEVNLPDTGMTGAKEDKAKSNSSDSVSDSATTSTEEN